MKYLYLIIILPFSINIYCQNIELSNGLIRSTFYSSYYDDNYSTANFSSEWGYSFKLGIDGLKIDWMNLSLTIGYDNYSTKVEAISWGMMYESTVNLNIDKSLISVGVYPINISLLQRIKLNIGVEISRLINESFTGDGSLWIYDSDIDKYNLIEKYNQISSKNHCGLISRLGYEFSISEKYSITPQYNFYLGLTDEFKYAIGNSRTVRHIFSFSINRDIK